MAIALVRQRKGSSCADNLQIALFGMSHAGQESYWLGSSNGQHINTKSGSGILDFAADYSGLSGYAGIARNSSKPGALPVFCYSPKLGDFLTGFDGYLLNGNELRAKYGGSTDGDIAARFIADANDFEKGVKNLVAESTGHFCVTTVTERGEAYAARCPLGVRPLVYGEGPNGHALVTESRALTHIGMERKGDLRAGQIVAIDDSGMHTLDQLPSRRKVCSFLLAYYQWIDCITEGISAAAVREDIGAELAKADKKAGIKIDIAAPIPDSGKGYAQGYAEEYGCLHSEPLIKYPYAGRSYDRPNKKIIDLTARIKLSIVPHRAKGKSIAAEDDSVRRGSQLVSEDGPLAMLRAAGAAELHPRIGSPRNIMCCKCSPPDEGVYRDDLLAANRFPTDDALADYLNVDSIRFIELDPFIKSIIKDSDLPACELCRGCYTGDFSFLDKKR